MKQGRVRMSDNSMKGAGLDIGDLALIDLGKMPTQNELCAAFTSWGELVIRRYVKRRGGDIHLAEVPQTNVPQIFAPDAVVIFGRVGGIEQRGAR